MTVVALEHLVIYHYSIHKLKTEFGRMVYTSDCKEKMLL